MMIKTTREGRLGILHVVLIVIVGSWMIEEHKSVISSTGHLLAFLLILSLVESKLAFAWWKRILTFWRNGESK
jgi:hypothetical protein